MRYTAAKRSRRRIKKRRRGMEAGKFGRIAGLYKSIEKDGKTNKRACGRDGKDTQSVIGAEECKPKEEADPTADMGVGNGCGGSFGGDRGRSVRVSVAVCVGIDGAA